MIHALVLVDRRSMKLSMLFNDIDENALKSVRFLFLKKY